MMRVVFIIFDTGVTYSCYSNKGSFVNFEENISARKIKGRAKGFDISGFEVVKYYVSI